MDFIELDEDSDDDSEYVVGDKEEDKYKTNLDSQCEILYLREIMINLSTRNINYYNVLMSGFTNEEMNNIQLCLIKAEKRYETKNTRNSLIDINSNSGMNQLVK